MYKKQQDKNARGKNSHLGEFVLFPQLDERIHIVRISLFDVTVSRDAVLIVAQAGLLGDGYGRPQKACRGPHQPDRALCAHVQTVSSVDHEEGDGLEVCILREQ